MRATVRGLTLSLRSITDVGIESPLPDLGNISLSFSLTFDTPILRRGLQVVTEQVSQPSRTEATCSQAARID